MGKSSKDLFERSKKLIPGGVNSPVRAFSAVGGQPVFFSSGSGARLHATDGVEYIDYVGSWGAMIAGHAHPHVVQAVREAAGNGLGFGAPTEIEAEFAETLTAAVPSLELVRAVNSGTEATMSAIRVARGHTGRDLLVKFDGCYHGHADHLLVKAGSGALTLGNPSSAGVPAAAAESTVVLPYNDSAAVADAFAARGEDIAAVIVEPVAGNMNMVIPDAEFLVELRRLCDRYGAVLIFDEVMTGFRVAAGGAQGLFGVRPDLTCLGKVVGGGLPVGAFGGRRDVMSQVAPLGPVYQAGTLSGNPVALAAGLATLRLLLDGDCYESLGSVTSALVSALEEAAADAGVPFCARSIGGMFGLYFSELPPRSLADAASADIPMFARFHREMLDRGIYLAPSAFEAGFVGIAHGNREIEETATAAREAFRVIAA